MNEYKMSLSFPEVSESIPVTIKADCAEDALAKIQAGDGTKLHIGSPCSDEPSNTVSQVYIETIHVSKDEIRNIYTHLFAHSGREPNISNTASFPDGMEMDVVACSGEGDGESGWTEAILFSGGCDCGCTDCEEKYEGIWDITEEGVMYITVVVPEANIWVTPNIIILPGSCLDSTAQVIAHQTNCKGVMGAGVARAIREKYPEIMPEYQAECKSKMMLGECQLIATEDGRYVANLFGQDGFGVGLQTNYDALLSALNSLVKEMQALGLTSVSMPYNIGCGLAGGDWNVVLGILRGVFAEKNIRLELWDISL